MIDCLRQCGRASQEEVPDLVILDYMLPRKNAPEILTEIRNDPPLEWVPILVISGVELDEERKDELGISREHCLVKPMTAEGYRQLADTIFRLLDQHRLAASAR